MPVNNISEVSVMRHGQSAWHAEIPALCIKSCRSFVSSPHKTPGTEIVSSLDTLLLTHKRSFGTFRALSWYQKLQPEGILLTN